VTQQTFTAYDDEIPRYEAAVRREQTRHARQQLERDESCVNTGLVTMGRTYHDSWPAVWSDIQDLLSLNGFERIEQPACLGSEGKFVRPIGRERWIFNLVLRHANRAMGGHCVCLLGY
jgi:hypothetical protein